MPSTIGKLSSTEWQRQVFQKFSFSLEISNFITSNNYCELSIEETNSLQTFSWKWLSTKYTSLNNDTFK